MDLASLIGLILSLATVVVGIALGGNFGIFIDIPSVFITVGGTIGVTILKFKLTSIGKSFKVATVSYTHLDVYKRQTEKNSMQNQGKPLLKRWNQMV